MSARALVGRADEARISRARVFVPMRWVLSTVEPPAHFAFRSNFGEWRHLRDGTEHQHPGVDVVAPRGTRIYAARAGTVLDSTAGEQPNRTMGHYVHWQDAENPRLDYYAMHMQGAPSFYGGDSVSAGQTLGAIGTTGRSDGPHLHFGMRLDGRFVDSYPSLAAAFERSDQATLVQGSRVGQLQQGFITPEQSQRAATENENAAFWTALNARALRELTLAESFAWPEAVLDAHPEGSETRSMLREARMRYQAAARTFVAAFRAYRDRGERERATATVQGLELSGSHMRAFVQRLDRLASRTFLENIAHGADDIAATASAIYEDATGIVHEAAGGIGLGLVLVGGVLLVAWSRKG